MPPPKKQAPKKADPMAAYAQAAKSDAGSNILAMIAEEARRQLAAERKVAEAEAALKLAQEELRAIAEGTLVQLMENASQLSVTTSDKYVVTMGEDLKGSLPKGATVDSAAKRKRGIAFILEAEPAIIDHEMRVDLGRPPATKEEAADYADRLRRATEGMKRLGWEDIKVGMDVHHSRLKAFARELIAAGKTVPLDDLGLSAYKRVSIKRPD